jgi:hypothetical protein
VVVAPFATDGPDANFTLFQWLLGSASAGNMTVTAPASAVIDGTGTTTWSFSASLPERSTWDRSRTTTVLHLSERRRSSA